MKRVCKDIDITDKNLIRKAVYNCLHKKYTRTDTLQLLENESGLKVKYIKTIYLRYGRNAMHPFVDILINTIHNELINKNINFLPIWYSDKVDASSGKVRHIGIQNIKQQIYDYIAVEGLRPLLKRIGVHQYASIRGRGQLKGAKRIRRWLANKNYKYYVKLDIKKCYPSIPQDKLIHFLNKHVKNEMLLWLIEKLISTFESGLSIGSYLSQFLCNLFLSQIYHFIGHLHKNRKIKKNNTYKKIALVQKRLFYMDDMLLIGKSSKDLKKAVKYIITYCKSLGLTIKAGWNIQKISENNNFIFIDMMGFRIYRTHMTIRQRVFKRIRRLCIRLYKKIKTYMYIHISKARAFLSYWGVIKNTNSHKFIKKYHVIQIMRKCKGVVRYYEKSKILTKTTPC